MSRMKPILGILLILIVSMAQVGGVLAAPASQEATPITGNMQSITLESDPTTGVVTVIVAVMDSDQVLHKARVSQKTAIALGVTLLDEDGNPVINKAALGQAIEIDPATVIPEQERPQHPVASALATFFSDIDGVDYETIMSAHETGIGFGVIAQALWLTSELGEDVQLFQDLLYAKQNNDYSAFRDFTEDGTPPKNWGQLRKALLSKKDLESITLKHDQDNGNQGSGNQGNNNSNKNKDKDKNKDKNNNGHGNGNDGNGNHGNGNGNGHNK